ncbi:MAG: MBL fold metallo-hydrolase [Stackebrandtia sp.]
MSQHLMDREIDERPTGYFGPNLSPEGLELLPRELAPGVHALMASRPPKDNNGVIVGSKAALVIDAGITPAVGRRIREHAAELSPVRLRYLVNTTYHGDHTFGNSAFDDLVQITSTANRDNMHDLDYEKRTRSRNMYGAEAEFDTVDAWRQPDVVFDSFAEIDLGDQIVQLHHFGPGNGPGDTIVYVPSARTAWTGNFLAGAGSTHMLLQAGPEPYLASVRAMRDALPEAETIVTGHGPRGAARPAMDSLIAYLEMLRDEVSEAVRQGRDIEETYETVTDPWADGLDSRFTAALNAEYPGLAEEGLQRSLGLTRQLHRLNILTTYRVCENLTA